MHPGTCYNFSTDGMNGARDLKLPGERIASGHDSLAGEKMTGSKVLKLEVRHWLFLLVLIAFVWLVLSNLTEIERLSRMILRASWQLVVIAALLQVIYYVLCSALYQAAFASVELESNVFELLPVVLASLFINVIAPIGGMAGIALFADDAALRGRSPARAAAGMLLVTLVSFIAFSIILISGLSYLFLLKHLSQYQVLAAIILLLSTLVLGAFLLLAHWWPRLLETLLGSVQSAVNWFTSWFRRQSPLASNWAAKNTTEFIAASRAIGHHHWSLGRALLIALLAHLISMASLYVIFLSFNYPITFPVLVAGYSMGILFAIVSPTPQGIGIVEGVMPAVFRSLKVRGRIAIFTTLTFRGLNFWIPLAIGFFLLRHIRSFRSRKQH